MLWAQKDDSIREWYAEAIEIRHQIIHEKIYTKLKNEEYGDKSGAEKVVGLLKGIQENIRKKADSFRDAKVVKVSVVSGKNFWKLKDDD